MVSRRVKFPPPPYKSNLANKIQEKEFNILWKERFKSPPCGLTQARKYNNLSAKNFTKQELENEKFVFILVNDKPYNEVSMKAIQYLVSRFNVNQVYNFEIRLNIIKTSYFKEIGLPDWKGSFLPYMRFFPNAIEQLKGYKRALFLDSDMSCYCDLRELFALDLGKAAAAGVWDITNCTARSLVSRKKAQELKDKLGANANLFFNTADPRLFGEYMNRTDYFNAGFLLYDLENWEKYEIGQKALKVAAENICIYPEQEALAVALSGHSLVLPPCFNAVNPIFAQRHYVSCADGIWDFNEEFFRNLAKADSNELQKQLNLPFAPLTSNLKINILPSKNYLKIELNEAFCAPKIVHLVNKPEVNLCENFGSYFSGFAPRNRKPINELYYFWLKNFFPQN